MDFRRIVERLMGEAPAEQHAATATVIAAAAGLFLLSVLVPAADLSAELAANPAASLLLPLARSI